MGHRFTTFLRPRSPIAATGRASGQRPNGDIPRSGRGFPCGRAEPAPPRDWSPELGWPRGGRPGDTRGPIFSEGRGLRVRVVRPHECRGIPFWPDDEARGPWPTGHMPRSSPCAPRGRAEPAPPRGASVGERAFGENPGIMWKSVFSEGRGFRARGARPCAYQKISSSAKDRRKTEWPVTTRLAETQCCPLRACRARPPGEGPMKRVSRGGRASPPGLRIRAPGREYGA